MPIKIHNNFIEMFQLTEYHIDRTNVSTCSEMFTSWSIKPKNLKFYYNNNEANVHQRQIFTVENESEKKKLFHFEMWLSLDYKQFLSVFESQNAHKHQSHLKAKSIR